MSTLRDLNFKKTYCWSILIAILILDSCSEFKPTNFRTDDGLEQVNGLNGPVEARWSNIHLNNQSGAPNFTNIRKDQSGCFKLEINTSIMILHQKYAIAVGGGAKKVSVKEGDLITLYTGVFEIREYQQILWKTEKNIVAEINKVTNKVLLNDKDEARFNGRLDLFRQSGDLLIRDSRTSDSDVYLLNMISSSHSIERSINVTVALGASSGICGSVVVLVISAVIVLSMQE